VTRLEFMTQTVKMKPEIREVPNDQTRYAEKPDNC
jgi:hypothetical protein